MPQLTDLLRLRTDLVDGNRLTLDPALQSLILDQLERVLDADVRWLNRDLNHSISLSTQENKMREVHDLATGMKEAIAGIKKIAIDAKGALSTEIDRANTNATKVKALASDLKSANLEVESFLGESGSNFHSGETDSDTQQQTGLNKSERIVPRTDINGVTVNPEVPK